MLLNCSMSDTLGRMSRTLFAISIVRCMDPRSFDARCDGVRKKDMLFHVGMRRMAQRSSTRIVYRVV